MQTLQKHEQHLLIVDDQPKNIQVIGTIIRGKGYLASFAQSGREALELVKQNPPDLILLDIMMPEMDGFETCRRLKENPETKNIPVIFLSALSDTMDKVQGFELGAVDYLTKPIQREEFLIRIQTHLEIQMHRKHLEEEVQKRTIELENHAAELEILNQQLQREIVEHLEAEEKIRYLQNLMKSIVDSMPSVLISVDPEGKVLHWNREAQNLTGLTDNQAKGRLLKEVFPQIQRQMEDLHHAMKDQETKKTEKVLTQNGETPNYSDITIYPLIANGVTGAVLRIDDVTERVRFEEMIVQTEKMMSIGGLAAGMAHEINNPLSIILQSTQNMLRFLSPENEKSAEMALRYGIKLDQLHDFLEKRQILLFLNGIRDAAERASHIIEDMLRFSRPSKSKIMMTDLPTLIDDTVALAARDYNLKKKYDFRKIQIIRDIEPDLTLIPCVTSELQQVLLNLLSNAAQSIYAQTDNSSPQIILRAWKEKNYAKIEVEDNGTGMEEQVRKRIFEPFFTTKETGVGTGLGLSVSYFIITTNHNGKISVESTLNKGSKFMIELPLNIDTSTV